MDMQSGPAFLSYFTQKHITLWKHNRVVKCWGHDLADLPHSHRPRSRFGPAECTGPYSCSRTSLKTSSTSPPSQRSSPLWAWLAPLSHPVCAKEEGNQHFWLNQNFSLTWQALRSESSESIPEMGGWNMQQPDYHFGRSGFHVTFNTFSDLIKGTDDALFPHLLGFIFHSLLMTFKGLILSFSV